MSLINKVLKDLESREGDPRAGARDRQMYADLRPSRPAAAGRRARMLLLVLLLIVAGLGAFVFVQGGLDPAMRVLTRLFDSTPTAPPVAARGARPEPPPPVPGESPVAAVEGSAVATAIDTVAGAAPSASGSEAGSSPIPVAAAPAGYRQPITAEPASTPAPKSGQTVPPSLAAPVPAQSPPPKAPVAVIDDSAEAAYREAVRLMQQKKPEAAEPALKRALQHDPDHVAARELLAGSLLERGRWSEAQQLLEQGLVELPYHRGFTFLLARIYVEQGAEPRAVALLEAGRADAGKNVDYLGFLATLYQRAGRHAEAAEAYRQAITLRPQDSKLWLGFAGSLEAQKNWPAAAEAYQRALATGGLSGELNRYASQRLVGVRGRL